MKRNYRRLLVVLALACAMQSSAYAFEANAVDGSLSVSGNTESKYVSVIVMPVGENTQGLTQDMLIDNRHLAFSGEASGGAVLESFGLPADFNSGEYKAVFFDNTATGEARFIYYNTRLDALSDELKEAEEKLELIRENAALIGIDESESEQFLQIISKLGDLKNVYSEAITVLGIKQGGLDDAVTYYGGVYGMDLTEYNALKPEVKEALKNKLSAADISNLKADYQKYLKESMFEKLENTDGLKTLLVKIGVNFTAYNKLSKESQNRVMTKMFNNLPKSIDDLNASDFERYVRDESNSGGSGGSGSGSSGSGSSGGPTSGRVIVDNTPPVTPAKTAPVDISSHWAKENILKLYNEGIVSGYSDGSFCPDNSITRAEFSTMIVKALGISIENVQESVFADVNAGDWHAPYVLALSRQGAVSGYDDGSFRPSDNIKRQDMAVIIYNILKSRGVEMSGKTEFADEAEISDYARDKVAMIAAAGVISGSDGRFNPMSRLTRAEAVTVIVKLREATK